MLLKVPMLNQDILLVQVKLISNQDLLLAMSQDSANFLDKTFCLLIELLCILNSSSLMIFLTERTWSILSTSYSKNLLIKKLC